MTWEDLHNTIRLRFKTLVADVNGLSTQFDNAPFDKPAGKWCRFTILTGDSQQVEIPGTFRDIGVAVAQLFDNGNNGDKDLLQLADKVKAAFRGVSVAGIRWRTPYIQRVGLQGKEYQLNVNCPFQADDVS